MINKSKQISKHENSMGRKENVIKLHCRGSHFTRDERLKLQYYYSESNDYRKKPGHTVLGKIFQKSSMTIKRKFERGMIEHMNTHLMRIVMYNADIIIKIKDKSALSVKQAFDKIERTLTSASFRNIFKSMTFDNGVF